MRSVIVSRFAPSTTGEAHPGTLLSALLVWLDANTHPQGQAQALLRLEDLDPERCKPEWTKQIVDTLNWLGLSWDAVITQSDNRTVHEKHLQQLAETGNLYACRCSRARLRNGKPAPDGGWAYDNHCRPNRLTQTNWRNCTDPIRLALPEANIEITDEGGLDLSQNPASEMGDPIVRRRDGAYSYQFAVVVDDAHAKVNRVVRGHDIAASTATQVAIYQTLGLAVPVYRHHFLLMDWGATNAKLAKLHGSIPASKLRQCYDPHSLLGALAFAAGLQSSPTAVKLDELQSHFDWRRVRTKQLLCGLDSTGQLQFKEL
jgi:glutamyl-Q tRNA(Asp) synthetase